MGADLPLGGPVTTPSLAHFVWLGHPLPGGDPGGPAEPVPSDFWLWLWVWVWVCGDGFPL